MRVIFHKKKHHRFFKYHRGVSLQNGRFFTSDCNSINSINADRVEVDGWDSEEVEIKITDLCGNCFRDIRKTRVLVDATGLSN